MSDPQEAANSTQETERLVKPTNFEQLVNRTLSGMTTQNGQIDQRILCQLLATTSSYLVMDTSTNNVNRPAAGLATWQIGFHRIVDVMLAINKKDANSLELETVNAASKACSECWSVASGWRHLNECRDVIRMVAAKLKTLLDENGKSFKGQRVYAP